MYWVSGRKILEAARIAASRPNLHMCTSPFSSAGPILTSNIFAREAAGAPLLILQFDGHGNDAGYMTRCEAYLDSKGILRCYQPPKESLPPRGRRPSTNRQADLHSAHGVGQRARVRVGFSRRRAGGRAYAALRPSHARLGARYTSGDECYPAKVTVGDFMKVLNGPALTRSAWPSSCPRRRPVPFGQYAPYLRHILDANGHQAVEILSPTSRNAYDGIGALAKPFVRTAWRALLCADVLQKCY